MRNAWKIMNRLDMEDINTAYNKPVNVRSNYSFNFFGLFATTFRVNFRSLPGFVLLFVCFVSHSAAQQVFTNPDLPIERRIELLSEQLTIEEKIDLLCAKAPAITRLGIPEYDWWSECLHGVARAGKATVFPKPIGMGSTWDDDLILRVANAVSDEARAKYHAALRQKGYSERYGGITFFSPTLNIARDPRWGRTSECFGEDPYLTGRIGAAYIKGLQGNDPKYLKLVATPKHFVANNEENRRTDGSATVDEISLREYYFPAFMESVRKANAASVMGAYNALNGVPCCANKFLLTDVLRSEWNFDGVVMSDGSAIRRIFSDHKYVKTFEEGAALALKAGCDMSLRDEYRAGLREAYRLGFIQLEDIDKALHRVLKLRFRLGMFDPQEKVPYGRIPESVVECPEHLELAIEAARKSIVLLKNEKLLPLRKNKIKKIALIGEACIRNYYGDYSGEPEHNVTLLDALNRKAGAECRIEWVTDTEGAQIIPSECLIRNRKHEYDGRLGFTASYFENDDFRGEPILERQELTLDIIPGRDNGLNTRENLSCVWETSLFPHMSGEYTLYYTGYGNTRILVDGKEVLHKQVNGCDSLKMHFEKGVSYPIRIMSKNINQTSGYRLSWIFPKSKDATTPERLAKESDVAVVFVRDDQAAEGRDRATLAINEKQQQLIDRVAAANPNTIVVFGSSAPLMIKDIVDKSKAFLNIWIAGQGEARAIADILFGDVNPSGRAPVTFFEKEELLPAIDDYDVRNGRSYQYASGNILFPFGYGLSYTKFRYHSFEAEQQSIKKEQPIILTVDISNTGKYDGEELIQCYAENDRWKSTGLQRKLVAYTRVFLKSGERKQITLAIDPAELSRWSSDTQQYDITPDKYTIAVGANADRPLRSLSIHIR